MSDVWSVQISGLINLPVSAGDLKGLRPSGWALTQLVLMKFCGLENYSCQKNAHVKSWAFGSLTLFFSSSLSFLFSLARATLIYRSNTPKANSPCLALPLARCRKWDAGFFHCLVTIITSLWHRTTLGLPSCTAWHRSSSASHTWVDVSVICVWHGSGDVRAGPDLFCL